MVLSTRLMVLLVAMVVAVMGLGIIGILGGFAERVYPHAVA
jgi:hypothetical protein